MSGNGTTWARNLGVWEIDLGVGCGTCGGIIRGKRSGVWEEGPGGRGQGDGTNGLGRGARQRYKEV